MAKNPYSLTKTRFEGLVTPHGPGRRLDFGLIFACTNLESLKCQFREGLLVGLVVPVSSGNALTCTVFDGLSSEIPNAESCCLNVEL